MRRDPRDPVSGSVIEAAIHVHARLGPGLLESVYAACLVAELRDRGVACVSGTKVPIVWNGRALGQFFRLDLLVAGELIVELKSVDAIHPVHVSQLITYLRLSGLRRGLLLNFNVRRLVEGVRRVSL